MPDGKSFPRLLYVGNVPVESTAAGAALLYRLLATWPADRLAVIELRSEVPQLDRRLPEVNYSQIPLPLQRLSHTRFGGWYRGWLFRRAGKGAARILRRLPPGFTPDAVITVAHAHAWVTAAAVAQRLDVPLHLIVHDDVVVASLTSPDMHKAVETVFKKVYRDAVSRMCVSPYMAELYEKLTGAKGDVLYPSRAPGVVGTAVKAAASGDRPLTFGFAGSVNGPGMGLALTDMARVCFAKGHRFILYTNMPPDQIARLELNRPGVQVRATIPFQQLIPALQAETDVLYAPVSFAAEDRANMEICFPSKLTDYTAMGLPLLLRGPDYCSAVRWAVENPGVAEVVTDESPAALSIAAQRLTDVQRRDALAEAATAVGNSYFSHAAVFEQFYKLIVHGRSRSEPVPANSGGA